MKATNSARPIPVLTTMVALALVSLFSYSCPDLIYAAGQEPYRQLPKLDLRILGCAPNPTYQSFKSRAELMKTLDSLAPHCTGPAYEKMKADFLRSLEKSDIRWEQETLLVLSEYYGTGMAKAHLELALASPGILKADIVWKVPPPPVTPDTVVFRFAFVVKRAEIKTVIVSGRTGEKTAIPVI